MNKATMNNVTPISGHNNPPDPIYETLAPFGDYISAAETWLDGEPVDRVREVWKRRLINGGAG